MEYSVHGQNYVCHNVKRTHFNGGHYLLLQVKVNYKEDLSNQLNIYTLCHCVVSSVETFGNENYLPFWVRLIDSERSFSDVSSFDSF